jgi:cytochrome oxidase Cu insertion factor (SCO1/SenC/PrrC family)
MKRPSSRQIVPQTCVSKFVEKLEVAGAVGTPKLGGPIKLTDQNGNLFDSTTLGKFMLVYFGFTHCPDVCPEELDKMSDIMTRVGMINCKSSRNDS